MNSSSTSMQYKIRTSSCPIFSIKYRVHSSYELTSPVFSSHHAARKQKRSSNTKSSRILCHCTLQTSTDICIIGGGAAGLTAAYFAAKHAAGTKTITLLEKNDETGKKILISGGQRCNILPLTADITKDYFSQSSRSAVRSAFSRWSLEECKYWLEEEIGIELALAEETSKLFPISNSSKEVRDKLANACRDAGVEIITSASLVQLTYDNDGSSSGDSNSGGQGTHSSKYKWMCEIAYGKDKSESTRKKHIYAAEKVILATGGKSFPQLGTTGTSFSILKSLGHTIKDPFPALTPLCGSHPGTEQLPGLSVYDTAVSVQGMSGTNGKKKGGKVSADRTAMLLTHRGFSGPAILDLSHYYTMATQSIPGNDDCISKIREENQQKTKKSNHDTAMKGIAIPSLRVSWLKDLDRASWEKILQGGGDDPQINGTTTLFNILKKKGVPSRLADALCEEAGMPQGRKLSELRKEERVKLLDSLVNYELKITGDEGYAKAEVTGGGVLLNELNMATMESQIVPGLYVCGELCDIHGRIGGFNFWWAWSSGRLAGLGSSK